MLEFAVHAYRIRLLIQILVQYEKEAEAIVKETQMGVLMDHHQEEEVLLEDLILQEEDTYNLQEEDMYNKN
jgi:hypothetical protein